MSALRTYYLIGKEAPENVFEYRHELIQRQPEIEDGAYEAFSKLLKIVGIDKFQYKDTE
jgi:hypothetical protein